MDRLQPFGDLLTDGPDVSVMCAEGGRGGDRYPDRFSRALFCSFHGRVLPQEGGKGNLENHPGSDPDRGGSGRARVESMREVDHWKMDRPFGSRDDRDRVKPRNDLHALVTHPAEGMPLAAEMQNLRRALPL